MCLPDIAVSVEAGDWPPEPRLEALAARAIAAAAATLAAEGASLPAGAELSLVFTNDAAIRVLNRDWRGKDRPTNVLSFPAVATPNAAADGAPALLGDVILSAETVAREAALADKPLEDHLSHLIIHGVLHLLGHDHETDADAEKMEQLERLALGRIGIPDPYAAAFDR